MTTTAPTRENATQGLAADELPPLRLADLYRLRLVRQPAVSPDGQRIAFVMYGFREKENEPSSSIWLVPSDGSAPARQLTRGAGNDTTPAWSPDGHSLAFLSTRPAEPELAPTGKKSQDEPPAQLWLLALDGGDPRQLTARAEGVESFDWSPAGDEIVFAARDPDEAQQRYLTSIRGELEGAGGERGPLIFSRHQHKLDGRGYLDDVRTHLFVVALADGAERRLTNGPCDENGSVWIPSGPRWSPRGDWIVFASNRTGDADNNERIDLWLVSPDGETMRRLTFGDIDARAPRWALDGRSLAFVASQTPNDFDWSTPELFWVSTADAEPIADLARCVGEGWSTVGGIVPALATSDPVGQARVPPIALRTSPVRSLTAALDRPVMGAPVWLNDEELLAPIADRGQTKLARISVAGGATFVYPLTDEYCTLHDVDAAGGTVAMTVNRPQAGTDLAVLPDSAIRKSEAEPQPRRLTHVNQELFAARAPIRYDRITFPNSEGQAIAGLVVLPPGFDPDSPPRPLILLPHGGPMGFDPPALQFYEDWFTGESYFAGLGYLVLMVDYRGSISYGQDFSWVIRDDSGPREADDVLSGMQFLIDRGWADPDRLFVTGCSYGGYLTAWVTGVDNRFRAAVAELPAWDLARSFGASDLHGYLQQDLGLPWHNPDGYRRASPSSQVLGTTTPTLIMAGEQDWRCPAVLAEAYYVTLKKIGVPTELVIYQGEHHASRRPKRTVDRAARIARWFARYGGLPFADDTAQGYPDPW